MISKKNKNVWNDNPIYNHNLEINCKRALNHNCLEDATPGAAGSGRC